MSTTQTPIDVWMKFDTDTDEEPSHEANTFDSTNDGYRIDWYHNDVGLVTSVEFATYGECLDWYERNGYRDFSS